MATFRTDARQAFDLARARRDGAGALVLECTPAKYDAVQAYTNAREYRPRSEVASEASLATWVGLPVTVSHPPDLLASVHDARDLAVGYVRRAFDRGDGWLGAEVVIVDSSTIDDIEAGRLVELSGGYVCKTVPSYRDDADAEQRSIKMNHVALLAPGLARAGAEARLR